MIKNNIKLNVSELEELCLKLDPYQEISSEHKKLLKSLGLDPDTIDPFTLSNQLLQLLDQAQRINTQSNSINENRS